MMDKITFHAIQHLKNAVNSLKKMDYESALIDIDLAINIINAHLSGGDDEQ